MLRNEHGTSVIGLAPRATDRADLMARLGRAAGPRQVTDLVELADHPAPPGWDAALAFAVQAAGQMSRAKVSVTPGQVRIDAVTDQWYAGALEVRFDGGESGVEVVERHRRQFEEIADLHRGETALVVGHQTALGIVVPSLARNVTPAWARENELANAECIELENDAERAVPNVKF